LTNILFFNYLILLNNIRNMQVGTLDAYLQGLKTSKKSIFYNFLSLHRVKNKWRYPMALYNWLKPGKNKDVNVVKLQEECIGIGEMAAGHPTGAAASIKRMMDQKNMPPKILVVGDGRYSKKLRDYTLKMAQRLDCEIVALNVSKPPLPFAGESAGTELGMFPESPMNNMGQFIEQSQAMGVNVKPVTQPGDRDQVIAELSAQDPSIRYVVSEPECAREEGIGEYPMLDLDLGYSRL